jgi:outer membrane murein-binding lipoprotein Lpp
MIPGWQRSGWVGFCVVAGIGLVLAGCDYWPPALQTQIEQLRSEVQAATAERAQLQNQLGALTKVKDDLQAQVDDLSRANREKTSMINSLQNSLAAAQERLAKQAKPAPAKASTAKAPAKSSSTVAAKKKTTKAH